MLSRVRYKYLSLRKTLVNVQVLHRPVVLKKQNCANG